MAECRGLAKASDTMLAQILHGEGIARLLEVLRVGTPRAQAAAADILRCAAPYL